VQRWVAVVHDNIDTGCLAAHGFLVVFGTKDRRVFRSLDGGAQWSLLSERLPSITAVTIDELRR
jgi:hypothetical protein